MWESREAIQYQLTPYWFGSFLSDLTLRKRRAKTEQKLIFIFIARCTVGTVAKMLVTLSFLAPGLPHVSKFVLQKSGSIEH